MKEIICYVHFLGFMPALVMSKGDIYGIDLFFCAVFSWGAVIARIIGITYAI